MRFTGNASVTSCSWRLYPTPADADDPRRHPSSQCHSPCLRWSATHAVVEWSRRIYQNHLRRRVAQSARSVRSAGTPRRCRHRAGIGRSAFRCRRLRHFRGCLQPRSHRPQMPQMHPAQRAVRRSSSGSSFPVSANPYAGSAASAAEQAAAIPAIDLIVNVFVLIVVIYRYLLRYDTTKPLGLANRIISSISGFGISPGTYTPKLRARTTASHTGPVRSTLKY